MYGYIYETTNLLNGKKYIGQHRAEKLDKNYLGSGIILHQAIEKYGKDNFSIKILEECESQSKMNEREIYWIEYFNAVSSKDYYNLGMGGTGWNNSVNKFPMSDARRNHISLACKGRPSPRKGKHHTKKAIEKNRQAHLEVKLSEETKKKISLATSGKNNPMYGKSAMLGKHHSEETKRKMSESAKGRKMSEESKEKLRNYYKGKIKIVNKFNKIILIKPEELDKYINSGWKRGIRYD